MRGDWLSELGGEDRKAWDAFVDHVRRETVHGIDESAFVMSVVPTDEVDVKFAVELGLAIMLDKPLLIVAQPGAHVPERLRQVAGKVVEVDIDTREGAHELAREVADFMERNG